MRFKCARKLVGYSLITGAACDHLGVGESKAHVCIFSLHVFAFSGMCVPACTDE